MSDASAPALPRLGVYQVEGVLGRGGMGLVVRARAPDGRAVAIKSILPDRLTPNLAARFEREGAIRIEHPNVVRVLDTGRDVLGNPFIVFELLEGTSLAERLEAERALSPAEVVRILVQACAGLEAAHAQGVVHRDLKPANVFLCADGAVKLLDFGIAFVENTARLTGDAALLGTPAYLSPEQARGVRDVDARTDVWALGVLAYEALSGRLPFDYDPPVATLLAIIQEPVAPLREVAPHVSEDLAAVIQRCLAKSPADRWPSADALAAALAVVEAGEQRIRESLLPARRPVAGSIRSDELRVVVVLLARGATDRLAIEEVVRDRGGEAIPLLSGDVIGLFGADTWRGDEARRATSAALALRHLAANVAVSSSRARADASGIVGDGLAWAHDVAGLDVEGVAVEPRTARALGERFVMGERAERFVEVLAESSGEAWADEADPSNTLVGRQSELVLVEAAVDAARTRAALVVLAGPAGIGKTRLRQEIERLVAARDPTATILVGGAEPFGHQRAYAALATALRRASHRGVLTRGWPPLRADAPPFAQRQAVLALVRDAIPDRDAARRCADGLLPLLVASPSLESIAATSVERDPELASDRLRLALLDYFAGLCAARPVALFLEDAQWMDAESLALVRELSVRLCDAPLLVVVTARGAAGEVEVGEGALRIELGGLGLEEVRAIAERAAGARPPDPVARALAERTEGNPLFVEQIAATLGARVTEADPRRLPLPFTVEAAVQARLDELPPRARETCKAASLFGRAIGVEELAAAAARAPAQAAEDVVILVARGVLSHVLGAGVRFNSPLVAGTAYRTMSPEARAELHLRVARHLADRPGADLEEVAVHFERAGELGPAAALYARAAIEAAATGASARALRASDRAIELGVPKDLAYRLHAARADTFRYLRRRSEQQAELARALEVARSPGERARALIEQVALTSRRGDPVAAVALSQEAIDAAAESGEPETHALAVSRRAQALALAGEHEEARAAAAEALALGAACGARARAVITETAALAAWSRGDLGAALDHYAEAVRLSVEAGDERRAAGNEGNLADFYNRVGDYGAAEAALRAALAGCRRVGNRVYEGYVLANLGCALERGGRALDALAPLGEAEAIAVETGDARLRAAVHLYRAHAHLALGGHEAALLECDRALERAREGSQDALAAAADAVAARVELARGAIDAALARSEAALAVRDALGGADENDADVFLARVLALRAAGRTEEAERVRERGAARVRATAQGISRAEWRTRFLRDVAAHRALLGEPP